MNRTSEVNESDFDLMVEIGFLALDAGLHEQHESLMQHLVRLRDDKPYPAIGLALNRYVRGDVQSAIAQLREVLVRFPEAVYTRSLLAKFLKESQQSGWEPYARQVLTMVDEGIAADMARELLDDEHQAGLPSNPTSVMDNMRGRRA